MNLRTKKRAAANQPAKVKLAACSYKCSTKIISQISWKCNWRKTHGRAKDVC